MLKNQVLKTSITSHRQIIDSMAANENSLGVWTKTENVHIFKYNHMQK